MSEYFTSSFTLNITIPTITIVLRLSPPRRTHMMFTTHSMKLMKPFHARSPGVYPAGILSSQLPNSAYALRLTRHRHGHQSSPAFTHGGRSDAEMATPTSDDVLRPEMASATPTPDGSAMKKPRIRLCGFPRFSISMVGQPGQISPLEASASGVQMAPTRKPERN